MSADVRNGQGAMTDNNSVNLEKRGQAF